MSDTFITIIAIALAAVLMFIFPLLSVSERSDDISQLSVASATAEFVDEVIKTGKIKDNEYKKFNDQIATTGNTYDVNIELKILDENTAKTLTEGNQTELGNNTYFSIYTSQIEEMIGISANSNTQNGEGQIILKQGDVISITVKNNSKTISQLLKSFFSGQSSSKGVSIIAATASGTVAINGTR